MRRSFVRGKVRRLRARLAAALPGRHGVPPPVTTNRCEELADEEVSASRKRGPCRETAELERRKAFAAERRLEDPLRQAALRPPRILRAWRLRHSRKRFRGL